MQQYVAGFMFSENMDVVALVRKARPDWQAGKLNGIGGKIEPGETPIEAMRREFREETGVDREAWEPFVRLFREGVYEVFFFVAYSDKVYNAFTQTDEEIVTRCALGTMDWIVKEGVPNLRWLVPLAADTCIAKGSFIPVEDVAGF